MFIALVLTALAAPAKGKAPPPPTTPECMPQYTAMMDAGPAAAGKAFAEFAACDAPGATAQAPMVFPKIISGPGGDAAAIAAMKLGLGDLVRSWAGGLQPDERSQFIDSLGKSCDKKEVPEFFVSTFKVVGDKFWSDRWYAGLDECRVPATQDLLRGALASPGNDRARYQSILQTFAANLGKDAVVPLTNRLKDEGDPEVAAFLVAAFANAAGVGSPEGMNVDAAQLAVDSIRELAPTLPIKAIEQARITLLDLKSEEASDALAAVRYKDVLQPDGSLLYAIYARTIATCKKGDLKVEVHTAPLNGGTHAWPDELSIRIPSLVNGFEWHLPKDCKGELKVMTPPAPFKNLDGLKAWIQEQDKETLKAAPGAKPKLVAEKPVLL